MKTVGYPHPVAPGQAGMQSMSIKSLFTKYCNAQSVFQQCRARAGHYSNCERSELTWWFLAIPHIFILCFLYVAVVVITIISWFSILLTGNYSKGLFEFVVGVMRWSLRVNAYAVLLTTDKYPPFSLH